MRRNPGYDATQGYEWGAGDAVHLLDNNSRVADDGARIAASLGGGGVSDERSLAGSEVAGGGEHGDHRAVAAH